MSSQADQLLAAGQRLTQEGRIAEAEATLPRGPGNRPDDPESAQEPCPPVSPGGTPRGEPRSLGGGVGRRTGKQGLDSRAGHARHEATAALAGW